MDVKTIDERIRQRAVEDLKSEVNRSLIPLRKYFQTGSYLEINGARVSTHTLIDQLENKIIEVHSPGRIEVAISDFLTKVETLEHEVAQLRESVA